MPVTRFQYAIPVSDVSTSWTRNPSGGSLYTAIDESPFDVSDNITSPDFQFFPGLDWTTEHGLSAVTNPNYYADGWNILFEAAKSGSASNNMRVDLKNGSTVLATRIVSLSNSIQDFTLALTPTEAAAIPPGAYIGGWSLVFTALAPFGSPASFVIVYGAKLQLPAVGFNHLDSDSSGCGYVVVGPHAGHYLIIDPSGSGYKRITGSETSGALILSGGDIKISP